MSGRRRVAIVTGGTLALSAAVGAFFAAPAFAYKGTLAGTPCSKTARVCIDLDDQKGWLAKDGKVVGSSFRISSGGYGKETPVGTFRVLWKNKDHASREFPLPNGQPAPMPNSVFFASGGIALHGGSPTRASAGCIHVPKGTDATVYNSLNVGDEVQVVQSLDKVKGGFYGVNNVDHPAKKKTDTPSAEEKKKADEKKKAEDKKKSESRKKDDDKKKDKKDDKKKDKKD